MKENETSEKKSSVKFDESKNVIKEFAKNERIESLAKQKQNAKTKTVFEEDLEVAPKKLRRDDSDEFPSLTSTPVAATPNP